MSGKKNKLVGQEGKEYYGKEAMEETKKISQGDDEFDRGDNEFEEAHVEDIVINRARIEEIAARAR